MPPAAGGGNRLPGRTPARSSTYSSSRAQFHLADVEVFRVVWCRNPCRGQLRTAAGRRMNRVAADDDRVRLAPHEIRPVPNVLSARRHVRIAKTTHTRSDRDRSSTVGLSQATVPRTRCEPLSVWNSTGRPGTTYRASSCRTLKSSHNERGSATVTSSLVASTTSPATMSEATTTPAYGVRRGRRLAVFVPRAAWPGSPAEYPDSESPRPAQ